MKFPKPFFRKSKQAWYVQLGSRQISLGKDRDPAFKRYHELLLHERGQAPAATELTVAQVFDLFLDWCKRHNAVRTFEWYSEYLQSFSDLYGRLRALDLKPFHVTQWLDRHSGWGEGGRRCAITAIKRAYNWVKRDRKPKARSRDRILSADERQEISGAIRDQAFRDFVFALGETGCRPSEVRGITAAEVNLDEGTWVLKKHKTVRKTGKPRVVYLTPVMVELTKRLMVEHPTGPLFRNRHGGRWTRNAIRCRFRRLRKKLPALAGVIAYTYRHSYATDALVNGVGVVEVAELMGHKDLHMIQQHYGHLAEKREHLRQAAVRATRPPTPTA